MTRPRPASVRVYFDEDVLGLARLLCQRRHDFTFPGDPGARIGRFERPACPITTLGVADRDWIPEVAARDWLIVTRDARMQEKRAEIDAVREHGAKMVNLASRDAGTVWAQLEVFMTRWREIEALIEQPGPFIRIVTRTGALREVDLAE